MPSTDNDCLTLTGLGGFFNGESFVLKAGQSATAGATSLATFPVTLCRNYRRLRGSVPIDSLLSRMAPEHVRFLYIGDGRLIVENLAGRDVRAGWRAVPDREEIDLHAGRVEVAFAFGERIVASIPTSPETLQELAAPPDGTSEIEGVFMALLSPGGLLKEAEEEDELELLPGGEERDVDPERDTGPIPEVKVDAPKSGRGKRRKGFRLFRLSPPVLFSFLFHAVLGLGLFSYVTLVASRGRELTAEMTMERPDARRFEEEPPPSNEQESEVDPVESEVPEPASVHESEASADHLPELGDAPSTGPGEKMGVDTGATGLIGLGAGGIGGAGRAGGSSGGKNGGGKLQSPIRRALDWLRDHQLPDGSWSGQGSLDTCGKCSSPARREYRIAMTGLAILAFAGSGSTHRDGDYRDTVRKAAQYLGKRQDATGRFHPPGTSVAERMMYGHAIATFAVSELYRNTKSPYLRRIAERAVRFAEDAQTPYAGWRYRPRDRGSDTSVTGWQMLALASAEQAGIPVNPAVRDGVRAWLDEVTEDRTYRVGYSRRGRGSLGMTATGMFLRQVTGSPRSDPAIRAGRKILVANPPILSPLGAPSATANATDLNYWYFATLALGRMGRTSGRDSGKAWSRTARDLLLPVQERGGHERGSFAPIGRWSRVGGRVMTTALVVLVLEHAYGYEHVFR